MRFLRLLKGELARESKNWVEEGIISQEQAVKLCQRYGIDPTEHTQRTFVYNLLMTLGYLFIGLALITLIGANWDELSREVRMGGVILITFITQFFAIYRYQNAKSSTALFFLGNLFYGASIILIAQVYHLGEHMPDGVLWWALGILPFALLLKAPWLALQAAVLSLIWAYLEVDFGFYPWLYPVFLLSFVWILFRGPKSLLLFLLTLSSIFYAIAYSMHFVWRDPENYYSDFVVGHLYISFSLFIFSYIFSYFLASLQSNKAQDYASIVSLWGLRFILLLLLFLSFEWVQDEIIDSAWPSISSLMAFSALLIPLTLGIAYRVKKVRLALSLIVVQFAYFTAVYYIHEQDLDYEVYLQIAINILLVLSGIYLIIRGVSLGVSHFFFMGVTMILLTAFLRYIDLIGNYIGGALLFMLFASLLLAAAKYWRHVNLKGATNEE